MAHQIRYTTCATDYLLSSPWPLVAGNERDERTAYQLFLLTDMGDGLEEQCEGCIVPDGDEWEFDPINADQPA